jgi:hypothetical protein
LVIEPHPVFSRLPKYRRGYSHLKEEALDRTMWRARFRRGYGPVVRQTTKWINLLPLLRHNLWYVWVQIPGFSSDNKNWSMTESQLHFSGCGFSMFKKYLMKMPWNNAWKSLPLLTTGAIYIAYIIKVNSQTTITE